MKSYLKISIKKKPLPNKIDPNIVSISKRLSDHLGLNVKIDFKEENQKSKITIHCNSLDKLNSLIDKLENKDV